MQHTKPSTKPTVSHAKILRAVASSSAIETNESPQAIEKQLKSKTTRWSTLTLAL